MKALIFALLGLVSVVTVSEEAAADEIGVFPDLECAQCNLVAPAGEPSTFYITASFSGTDGIASVELRVVGLPDGWSATATPNPLSNVSLGNPLGLGANIAFPTGQTVPCLLLYTVEIIPTGPVTEALLEVVAHAIPSNVNFPCPGVIPGCVPCFTYICLPGGSMTVNSGESCLVSVEPRSWSAVKGLYSGS